MKVCQSRVLALLLLLVLSASMATPVFAQEMKSLANNALLKQAQSLYNDQKYKASFSVFLQAYRWSRSTKADQVVALKYMSFIHIILGRFGKARSTIFKLLSINPSFQLDSAWDPPKFVRFFARVRKEFIENSKARIFSKNAREFPANKDLKLKLQVRDLQKRVKQVILWFRLSGQDTYTRRVLQQQTVKEWNKSTALWWKQPAVFARAIPTNLFVGQKAAAKADDPKDTDSDDKKAPAARKADAQKVDAKKADAKKAPAARKPAARTAAPKKSPAARKAPTARKAAPVTPKPAARTAVPQKTPAVRKAPTARKPAARPVVQKAPVVRKAAAPRAVTPVARPVPRAAAPTVRKPADRKDNTTVTGPVNIGLYYFSTIIPALKALQNKRAFYFEYYVKAYDNSGRVLATLGSPTKPEKIKRTVEAPPPPRRRQAPVAAVPAHKTWWFWTAIVGGTVLVAGGVTAAILLTQQPATPTTGSAVITIARIK